MRQSQRRVTCGHDRIAIEAEERHGGREHAGALVLGLVEQLARGARRRPDAAPASPRCGVVIIARSVVSIGRLRIGEEGGDAGERLVRLGVEDMQDRADQQRVAGLLPMVAPLERAFGIDQDVGDVLDVAHLLLAAADLEQRIVGGRLARRSDRTAGTRQKRARQPAVSCQFSPLMSWTIAEPGQVSSVGTTRPTPLPRAGRREAQDMLGPVVAQIVALEPAEHDAVGAEQAGRARSPRLSPSAPSRRSRRSSPRARARPTCRWRRATATKPPDAAMKAPSTKIVRRIGVVDDTTTRRRPAADRRAARRARTRARRAAAGSRAARPSIASRPRSSTRTISEDDEDLAPEDLGRGHSRRPFLGR